MKVDQLTPAVPTPGVIASLSVRPWVDTTLGGKSVAPMLITHPPALRDGDTAIVIEERTRGVAHALGAAPAHATVPDVGTRIAVHRGVAVVRLDGTEHALTTRAGTWGRTVTKIGHVLLVAGLDPLAASVRGPDLGDYLTSSAKADRLYLAAARVAARPRLLNVQDEHALHL